MQFQQNNKLADHDYYNLCYMLGTTQRECRECSIEKRHEIPSQGASEITVVERSFRVFNGSRKRG